MYVIGGNSGSSWLGLVERLAPGADRWAACQPLPEPRGYAAAVALGRRLFVVGGGDGGTWQSIVQCCDLDSDRGQWDQVSLGQRPRV